MILPYLLIFLFFPVLVGILSVDINGQPFSAIDYIEERLGRMNNENEESDVEPDEPDEGFINSTNSLNFPEVILLPDQVNEGLNQVWAFFWFLGSQSKDLGVWIGVNTAPFHYVIALVISILALFSNQVIWIVALFYLLVTEWDEFKNIRKKDAI